MHIEKICIFLCIQISVFVRQNGNICSFKNDESWVILSEIEQRIKEKIERIGTPLKDWDINIYRGILTGYNDAFIIDGEKRKDLINQDPKSEEIIRPILRGRDIKRYGYNFADLWLINTHNGIKEKGIKPIKIDDYPAIKKHLDSFYPKLNMRADKGDTPYNLRNCAYMEDFYKQKIIFQEMVQEPSFIFDEEGQYMCLDTARIITGKYLEILLSVLNSKLFFYAVKMFYGGGALGKTGIRMKHTFFENFPIPIFLKKKQEEIKQMIKKPTEVNLRKIDEMLYNFYQLDKSEISFIDSQ